MRLSSLLACSVVLGITMLMPAAVHSQQLLEPITDDSDWERWTERPPVSGGLRVGVMSNTHSKLPDPEFVFVSLPKSDSLSLCLEISSRDARYSANLEYDIQDVEAGKLKLHIPTENKTKLVEYDSDSLVVLASLPVDECDGTVNSYLIAQWQQPASGESESDLVTIYLNSDNPANIAVGPGGDIEREPSCVRLSGETTAFNQRCQIRKSWFTPDTQVSIRIREAGTHVPYPLPLRVQ